MTPETIWAALKLGYLIGTVGTAALFTMVAQTLTLLALLGLIMKLFR